MANRAQPVEEGANAAHHVNIAALVPTADIVFFSNAAALNDDIECARVVLDVEPVADVRPGSINRQRFLVDGVENDQRDQLFGKVIRPVIVRTVRNESRKIVGARPGRNQVIGCSLRRRIGRTRVVRRRLDEQAFSAERSVDLIGRDVQEAESLALGRRQREPIGPRRLQHREGPDDVGLNERVAARYRAVDVAFGRQMDDMVRREACERLGDRAPVANVDFGELVVGRVVDPRQGLQIAGVGEGVDVEHVDAGGDEMPAYRRSDESRAAGYQHVACHGVSGIKRSAARSRGRRTRANPAGRGHRPAAALRCRGGNWPGGGPASDSRRSRCA